ncbi:MAG TPA: DMT family transporter [Bacillota bacterium]|nr:DMT family transporter [Bacillota bacterium]
MNTPKSMRAVRPRSAKAVGASLVVMSSLFYGSYGVWMALMGTAFGVYTQGIFRSLLVVLIVLPVALLRRQWQPIQWRRDRWWLLVSFLTSIGIAGPSYYATQKIGVGLMSAVLYAGIVLAMFFFGWLLSKERYTLDKGIATALGLVGLWLVFSPNANHLGLLGLGAALVAGLASGLNVVVSQKMPYGVLQTMSIAWSGGVLACLGMALLLGEYRQPITWGVQWLYLVLFVATSVLASSTVIKGVKLIDAGSAGILGLLEIIFGVLLGVVFFGERPGGLALVGMAFITLAAAIPYLHHFKLKDEPFELS